MRFHTRKWVKPGDLNAHKTLFGGRLLAWIDEEAALYAIVQLENQNVGLYIPGKGGGDRTVGGTVDFSFLIDDFENYFEKVKEKTKDISSDVITTADNLKIFETTDPSGNVITFRELPE